MSEFDLTRPITRHSDRRSFAEAIAGDLLGLDETDWLECKSRIEWSNKEDRAVHVARNILGFANRDPESAHPTVAGEGYLLIGVEPGELLGCDPIDPADLENALAPYLGDDGPRWSSERLPVGSVQILFIVVAAPRAGDPIYVLHRQIGKYQEGNVFVRRRGKTEIANAAEMLRLQHRVGGTNRVSVSLNVVGKPEAARIEVARNAIENLIAAERHRLLAPLDVAEVKFGGGQKSALQMDMEANLLATISPMTKEQRQPNEYRRMCESYFGKMKSDLPRQLHHVAAARGNGLVRMQLANLSLRNFAGTEVEVTVDNGAFLSRGKDDWPPDLPQTPALWGSDTLMSRIGPPTMLVTIRFVPRRQRVHVTSTGRTAIFDAVNLRPHKNVVLPPLHILVPETYGSQWVEITWLATSATADGQAAGSFRIPVSGPVLRVADVLERGSTGPTVHDDD